MTDNTPERVIKTRSIGETVMSVKKLGFIMGYRSSHEPVWKKIILSSIKNGNDNRKH